MIIGYTYSMQNYDYQTKKEKRLKKKKINRLYRLKCCNGITFFLQHLLANIFVSPKQPYLCMKTANKPMYGNIAVYIKYCRDGKAPGCA